MRREEIAKNRLFNQQLLGTQLTSAQQVVRHFGAMQAQDYAMSKWAVGVRKPATDSAIEEAINRGEIIRTHIMRPTWHLVAAEDLRWMLELTAPHVKQPLSSMCKKYGLDNEFISRCYKIIEQILEGNNYLTRKEIVEAISQQNQGVDKIPATLIMMSAEQDGIVCNGPRRGKQITYALLDERVPPASSIDREEALTKLALRYFTSHGPASVQDFSWWSGLTMADSRKAIKMIEPELQKVQTDKQTYWYRKGHLHENGIAGNVHFLPAFDEFLVSYKDRSTVLDPVVTRQTITINGIFRPVIVVDGQVVGLWKRTIKKDKVQITTHYFHPLPKSQNKALIEAIEQYGRFVELATTT
ncbi:winged helix DNA-binding domain-containing protein [Rapidithrix thailandica]|uniref:Winged helix DNA-binding domain-containing protein n=1 Tax=Rapidithrix thailandica TaxID=413964 RepID=A0AAW9RV91_9BACT